MNSFQSIWLDKTILDISPHDKDLFDVIIKKKLYIIGKKDVISVVIRSILVNIVGLG